MGRHLETSRACPICAATFCSDDLRPLRFELVSPPTQGLAWPFKLVRRDGVRIGLTSDAQLHGDLTVESEDGWHFARRVLADPASQLKRLHAECRELEALQDSSPL